MEQLEIDLEIAIERALYFSELYRITEKNDLLNLWKKHNEIINELKFISKDFFVKLEPLPSPTGEKNKVFMEESYYYEFNGKHVMPVLDGLRRIKGFIQAYENSFPKNSLNDFPSLSNLESLNLISDKLYVISRQLRKRHNNRNTLDLTDEYDLQDLFHALLKLFFNDIRAEDVSPQYAGGTSRIDFILKDQNIGIELKYGRKGLGAKELGSQLIVDIARYKSYPKLELLYCFVFDPDGWIDNPKGIENDLTKEHDGLQVVVRVKPEK